MNEEHSIKDRIKAEADKVEEKLHHKKADGEESKMKKVEGEVKDKTHHAEDKIKDVFHKKDK